MAHHRLGDVVDMRVMAKVEDLIGPLIEWPQPMRCLALSTHLRYRDRFQLTLFLLGNALPPCVIREWYASQRCLRDVAARRHVESVIADFKSDKLARFEFWDMQVGGKSQCAAPTGINWCHH